MQETCCTQPVLMLGTTPLLHRLLLLSIVAKQKDQIVRIIYHLKAHLHKALYWSSWGICQWKFSALNRSKTCMFKSGSCIYQTAENWFKSDLHEIQTHVRICVLLIIFWNIQWIFFPIDKLNCKRNLINEFTYLIC
jgi:hypothetical protein